MKSPLEMPKPLPVVVEDHHGMSSVADDTCNFISNSDRPVVVVTIVGTYHT